MNAELVRIRKNNESKIQTVGNISKINPNHLSNIIVSLNANMAYLYNINNNPNVSIDDYINKIISNIYIILEAFNEMDIYPDYFYNVFFMVNEEYRSLASQGRINGKEDLYNFSEFRGKISYMMEKGLQNGNYKLTSTRVRDIGEYYDEMVDFLHKYYLPCEVMTVEMCKEMFTYIYNDVNSCINNNLSNSPYISDDVECLSRLLFDYIQFFAAIGINPKEYLDKYIMEQKEVGKSK